MVTSGIESPCRSLLSRGIGVDCLSGRLRSLSQSFVGPLADAALERMSFDRVFLGADAVTAENGICEADHARTGSRSSWPGPGGVRLGGVVQARPASVPCLGAFGFASDLVSAASADPAQAQKFRDARPDNRSWWLGRSITKALRSSVKAYGRLQPPPSL